MTSTGSFRNPQTSDLAQSFMCQLTLSTGLNEYMECVLPLIGRTFGAERVSLVDYYEDTDRFELLYFKGYAPDARFALQRRLFELDLRKALFTRSPYFSGPQGRFLLIPCYFREVLEAAVVIDLDEPVEFNSRLQELSSLVSRFLGLFMSSARLEVNRRRSFDPFDLQRARQIQLNFLPKGPPQGRRCELFGFNQSSNGVGGDYFDYFENDQGRLQCILADACGHGMSAALTMSNFRGILQSEIRRQQNLEELFSSLNEMIHFDDDFIQYLTGIFLQLDEGSGQLEYINAGHFEPLVVDTAGTVEKLSGGGPPLGMFKASRFPAGRAHLEPGSLIAVFTDGLVDVQNPEGEYYGIEAVSKTLREYRRLPLKVVTEKLVESAKQFSEVDDFEDDVTVFLMRLK